MKYEAKLVIRVLIAIILSLSAKLVYLVLAPITLYSSYFITKIFFPVVIKDNTFFLNNLTLEFVPACVAVAAYLLLSLLILLTKDIKAKTLVYLFVLGFFLILLANLIRIEIMVFVLVKYGNDLFATLDLIFWKVLSTVYIVLVWIFLTKLFKIKTIPVYSDVKYLIKESRRGS